MARKGILRLMLSLLPLAVLPVLAAHPPDHVVIAHGDPQGYPYIDYDSAVEWIEKEFLGRYLALVCEDSSCRLEQAVLEAVKAKVKLYDGALPGILLRAQQKSGSIVLIRGLRGLSEGPVTTWYVNEKFNESIDLPHDRPDLRLTKSISVDGVEVMLKGQWVACEKCYQRLGMAWRFKHAGLERTLAMIPLDPMVGQYGMLGVDELLIWVGDLDGDGKPDLLIRPQGRPDYLELALFLSREIREGKPWRPAARFLWSDPANPGC